MQKTRFYNSVAKGEVCDNMRRVNDELEGMERFIHFLWWILHARWTSPRDKLPTWLNASWWARKVSRGGKRESLAWQRLSYKLIQIFEVACFNSLLYLVPTIPLYSNLWENESEFTKLSWFFASYILTRRRGIFVNLWWFMEIYFIWRLIQR